MRILRTSTIGLIFFGLASVGVAACGSEVNGTGGTNGAGAGSSSSSTGTPGTTAEQACNDLCHKLETMNCTLGPNDCATTCSDFLADMPPECETAGAAQFNCGIANSTTCDEPAECKDEQEAFSTCQAMYGCSKEGVCFGGGGPGGETSCGCDETCKGTKYSTNCTTPAGGGTTTCDCLKDDTSVGTCTMTTDPGSCGPKSTCCNDQFFHL